VDSSGEGYGTSRLSSAAGLSWRNPSWTTCRGRLSAVQVRYLTSATSSGRTQWTRLNTVPRRRHRERHLGGREGLQPAPQSRQLRLFDTAAGAAGIDKASLGIVVGDQQRAEIGPASFGIASESYAMCCWFRITAGTVEAVRSIIA